MTTTETRPDAYWCGTLSQALREISRIAAVSPAECKRLADDVVARYERESGFPPPDAQIRAHVGEDMPLDFLKPGERLINGTIYYSECWLNDQVVLPSLCVCGHRSDRHRHHGDIGCWYPGCACPGYIAQDAPVAV